MPSLPMQSPISPMQPYAMPGVPYGMNPYYPIIPMMPQPLMNPSMVQSPSNPVQNAPVGNVKASLRDKLLKDVQSLDMQINNLKK